MLAMEKAHSRAESLSADRKNAAALIVRERGV